MPHSIDTESVIKFHYTEKDIASKTMNIQLSFEKLDNIDEKEPQQVIRMKNEIEFLLKMNTDEYKIVLRDKSKSRQYFADWWCVFGIPTQTVDGNSYSIKNFIACKYCKAVYRYSTTMSSCKIKTHKCYVQRRKREEIAHTEVDESSIKSTQPTLSKFSFKPVFNHDSDKSTKSKCNELIVQWISNNIRPFSIVDDEGLHQLLQFFYELVSFSHLLIKDVNLNVKSFIPSRYTISRNVHSAAEETRLKFRELLLEPLQNEAVTLSPDLWTDRFRQITYLGITATIIDASSKYRTFTLCCGEFTEKEKTGNNIEKVLKNCLSVYGITNLRDVNWVCDRGANILKCFRQNYIEPIKCYAHRLNNLLSFAFINKDADVDGDEEELLSLLINTVDQLFEETIERQRLIETIQSCKTLAGLMETIKHNATKAGGSATSLKQEVSSRWLSLYNCLESIFDNYEIISTVLKEKNKFNLVQIISKLALNQLLILLLPLRCATRDIQNDQHPTLYLVQPFHQLLIHTYSSYPKLIKFALDFEADRFQLFCNTYPSENTEPSESLSSAKKFEILSRLRSILSDMKQKFITNDVPDPHNEEQRRKKFKSLNEYIADFEDDTLREVERESQQNDDDETIIVSSQGGCFSPEYIFTTTTYQVSKPDEIDQYCAMKISSNLIGKDPMLFWSQSFVQETLPLLSKYARTIHSIPPTSASTERIFSISGLVINNRRTSLLPAHLDNVLVIRSALRNRVEDRKQDVETINYYPSDTTIGGLLFSNYISEEIRRLSVKELTSSQAIDRLGVLVSDSPYDLALRPFDKKNDRCFTCDQGFVACSGHLGHISLVLRVYNPVFFLRSC
ncbi:unnamed protein product [Rotaria sp. Silwood2]|nr:unnamed protein product [Rotaria sp. Silwood2]